jgi:hypothetical protein
MFRLLRMQMDTLDLGPDFTIDTLTKLAQLGWASIAESTPGTGPSTP